MLGGKRKEHLKHLKNIMVTLVLPGRTHTEIVTMTSSFVNPSPVLGSSKQLAQRDTTQGCISKAALFCQLSADNLLWALLTWGILCCLSSPWVYSDKWTKLNY